MTTAVIKLAKSMVNEIENLRQSNVIAHIVDGLEFLALLTLPILLPFGIMFLATLPY